jgi:hypothetical protein
MRFDIVVMGELTIAVWLHSAEDPPPERFDAACVAIQALKRAQPGVLKNMRMLVITDGGSPSAKQRAQLNVGTLDGVAVKTAAITNDLKNPIKRRIAQAILWTQPSFKAYGPNQWRNALAYLGIPSTEIFEVAKRIEQGLAPLETLAAIRADVAATASLKKTA